MRFTTVVTLCCLLLLSAPPARADRPEHALALKADRNRVKLGGTVKLTVKLTKRTGKPVEVNDLRLARNSVSLRYRYGEKTHTVTRIYGAAVRGGDGKYTVRDDSPLRATLKRGRGLTLELPLLAIRAGEMTVTAVYTGLDVGPPLLTSEELVIEVEPDGEKGELAAEMLTSEGRMLFSLFTEQAFGTVMNFATLAHDKRYDGLSFHRIMKSFMVQGGDPKGNGSGGPGWYIPAEFDPSLRHEKGILSMARAPAPDSAGCQFFIMHGKNTGLDGQYAAFGKLIEGEEVLDRLADLEVKAHPRSGELSVPVEKPLLKTIRLVTR